MSSHPKQRPLLQALAYVLCGALIVLILCLHGFSVFTFRLHDRWEEKQERAAAQRAREEERATEHKRAAAEAEARATLALRQQTLGPDDRLTLAAAFKLASVLFTDGKIAEARAILLPAYERFRAIAQPDDPVLKPFQLLALALEEHGEEEKTK